jgi:predicted permease
VIEDPPRLAERLLTWSLAGPDREAVLGDMCEEYAARVTQHGAQAAHCWYWRQVRRSFLINVRRRLFESAQQTSLTAVSHTSAGEASMQDLRYALRSLTNAPGFSLVVVLTLALGIGATTAIFSVVDAVLLRPLPYPDPDRIVSFAWRTTTGIAPANVSPLTFEYWRQHARAFDGLAVTSGTTFSMVRDGSVERVRGVSGTADFFKVIGVAPALGRGFLADECLPGRARVAVISHGLWMRVFGGTPDAVGASITLNDSVYTVIGVMPASFRYEPASDLWHPLPLRVDARDAGRNYTVLGRLRSGIAMQQAQAETAVLFQQFQTEHRQHLARNARGIELILLQDFLVADMRPLLLVLLGAVGLVLLIACGNVANLLLARSTVRARDMAIRSALGAGRARLARQTLLECLLLSLGGGLAAAALASFGVRALIAAIPGQSSRLGTVAVDARVLVFTLFIAATLGIIFGVVGSMRVLQGDAASVLKSATGTGIDRARHRLSNALVIGEVALSVILLIGAGLLVATFLHLRGIRLGFETDNMLAVQLFPSVSRFGSAEAGIELDRQLIDRIRAIPGVAAVTTASSLPLERGPNFVFGIDGDAPDRVSYVELRAVGPDYLSTLGIPLRAGRELGSSDAERSLPVVVVNETLARMFGGPASALGRRVVIGHGTPNETAVREIVGVASDVADGRPGTRMFPTMYLPRTQFASGASVNVLVRTVGATVAADVRRAVLDVDPKLPIVRLQSMADVAWSAVAQQRFNMLLTGVFAATALVLAMIGLYGLLSYQVAQRTREIGVRLALGARRVDVLLIVVRRGVILTCVGLVIGASASLGLTGFLKTLLFGVTPTSPWVYAMVSGVLLLVACLASLVPARRAMRADPVIALRSE